MQCNFYLLANIFRKKIIKRGRRREEGGNESNY
jgi:hypothetical protein